MIFIPILNSHGQYFFPSENNFSKEKRTRKRTKKIFFSRSKQLFATISTTRKYKSRKCFGHRRGQGEEKTCFALWYGQTMRSGNPEEHEILCLNVSDIPKAPNEIKDFHSRRLLLLFWEFPENFFHVSKIDRISVNVFATVRNNRDMSEMNAKHKQLHKKIASHLNPKEHFKSIGTWTSKWH